MSDTAVFSEAQPPNAIPDIVNFSTSLGAVVSGEPTTKVTFGTRSAEFRELNLADTWDMLEISGETANDTWLNLALMAMSLTALDGVPLMVPKGGLTKDELRYRMKKLGSDGMSALAKAMAETKPKPDAAAMTAAAKN